MADNEKNVEEVIDNENAEKTANEDNTEETVDEAVEKNTEETDAPVDDKKKKKKDKKDKKDEKIEELEDRVKRQMAEFENFRKRTEKEKSSMYEMGAKSVVEKILPVIDNFERGLAQVPEGSEDAFANGMQMI